jgi:alcohol dehydrogenase class IV
MTSHFRPFSIARLPRIEFGSGSLGKLAKVTARFGRRVLLVTGEQSFDDAPWSSELVAMLEQDGLSQRRLRIAGEPSPDIVNEAVSALAPHDIDVVVGVGGGSALDAAKAIAGLVRVQRPVEDYLEGVGPELPYAGPAVPFIAVPTTAGTGSEATKNAVLSRQGLDGYKKSFRADQLVAEVAIVDPDLLASCPPAIIAANGMDALTQLIESYVSLNSNVFTDALGISGLRAARDGLVPLFESGGSDAYARERMAYAALVSGINLAQTGLGSVHGLASPLGAFYPIPHGVVCGTLVAAATVMNINAMLEREPGNPALERYARVGEVLSQQRHASRTAALERLVQLLTHWSEEMRLQKLTTFGLGRAGIDHVVAHARGSSMKTNPIVLHDDEIRAIVEACL